MENFTIRDIENAVASGFTLLVSKEIDPVAGFARDMGEAVRVAWFCKENDQGGWPVEGRPYSEGSELWEMPQGYYASDLSTLLATLKN